MNKNFKFTSKPNHEADDFYSALNVTPKRQAEIILIVGKILDKELLVSEAIEEVVEKFDVLEELSLALIEIGKSLENPVSFAMRYVKLQIAMDSFKENENCEDCENKDDCPIFAIGEEKGNKENDDFDVHLKAIIDEVFSKKKKS